MGHYCAPLYPRSSFRFDALCDAIRDAIRDAISDAIRKGKF